MAARHLARQSRGSRFWEQRAFYGLGVPRRGKHVADFPAL